MENTMKHVHRAALRRADAANLARIERVTPCRSIALALAGCAALMQCLTAVQADDALPVRGTGAQPTQAQQPTYTPQGRQMGRYKAFARQAELPPITATHNAALQVGSVVYTNATRLAQLTTQEKAALAGQFKVPVAVIEALAQRQAHSSPVSADQLAQQIRTTVIDYRFLQSEWERYHPPEAGQKTKAAALGALQAGDITKAWELYDGLPRPQPPANVRVIAQP